MTEERKSNLKFGIDATAVKPGLEALKRDVKGAADDIKDSADGASKSIGGIGDGGREAAQKVEAGARSMIREIQRVTAQQQAGEKGTASYYAELAKQRNLGTTLDPYIEKLRQAEVAQRNAANGLGKMEISAKQTAAALRGVPAQFTDIVVSLQSGQAPLTVLLQQGGQLKDMFGGAGNAAKALGGYVVGLINPFTVAVAAVGAFGYAMTLAEAESRKLSNIGIAFQATGRAALLSAEDIKSLRREMSLMPGISKDAAGAVITEFARTRDIGADMLKGLSRGIGDFAVALGQDVPTAAKTLAKAFADPVKGAQDLDDALGFLTSNQQLTIKAMVEAGDKAGAQKLMLEALTVATKGLAKEGTELEKATDGFSKKWSEAMGTIGDSAALRRANEVLAGIITSAGEAAVALSKMKMPDWMMLLPGGAGAGLKLATSALGAMYPSKDEPAPAATRPVNWNGGKGVAPLNMADLSVGVPLTMYGQAAPVGPLRLDYPRTASPVTPTGAPTAAPALSAKELDQQVKTVLELNKNYRSQKGTVEDIRKEIALTSKTLKLAAAEDKANGIQNSPRVDRLQEILDGQKEKLESTLKKGGGMADAANAAVQAYKNADKEILSERKSFFDTMEAMVKAGKIGEMDAAERSMEKEDELYGRRKANFEAELANAKKKKNSDTEQARIKGQLDAAETEHEDTIARLRNQSAAAVAKAADELERMTATEEKAARASSERVKGARADNAEIGLTGEALGKVRLARVEDAAAELERRAAILGGTPESERFSAALRQQAQDLRDLAKERGRGDSARMVDDYTKAVNESAAAIKYETSLMGLSSQERDVAIAKYKIEIDLAKRLAAIKANNPNPDDQGEVDRLSADARATANKDADNAEKRIKLDEAKQTVQQYDSIFRQGFADMLNKGKDGWKSFTQSLATTFKTSVADAIYKQFAQPLVINMVGAMAGINTGGGAGGNPLAGGATGGNGLGGLISMGSSLYQGYTGLTSGQGILGSIGNYFGLGAASTVGTGATTVAGGALSKAALDGTMAFGANSVPGAAALPAGGGMSAMAAGGVAALVAAVVLNAVGAFRSETMIGKGLSGTLGKGDLQPWEEWRTGGTLFDGSYFETHNPLESLKKYTDQLQTMREAGQGASAQAKALQAVIYTMTESTDGLAEATRIQSDAIQAGYKVVRGGVVDMANNLGLAGNSVKDFTKELDLQDLNFDGLDADGIQKEIAAALKKGSNAMAETLIGSFIEVTKDVVTVIQDQYNTMASDEEFHEETETVTKRVYVPSEFARTGEKAIDTLTRLATSFVAVNDASDALGYGLHDASLSVASFASDVIDAFGGLEKFGSTVSAYEQNFYSDEERRASLARNLSREAKDKGIDISAETLLTGNRGLVRTGVDSVLDATSAKDPMYVWAVEFANKVAQLYPAEKQATEATKDLKDEVDELTQAFDNAVKSLKQERGSLQAQLMRTSGNETRARSLERDLYLNSFVDSKGQKLDDARLKEIAALYDGNLVLKDAIEARTQFNGLQDEMNALTDTATEALDRQRNALAESNRALFDNVQALKLQKTIAQELPGVLDKYRNPAQRRQVQYEDLAKGLTDSGIGVTASQLAAASKEEFAAAAAAVWNFATTTDDMRLSLTRAAGVMADIKDAEIDQAFANLERLVSEQLTDVSQTRDELKSLFDLLESSVDDLYAEVESTAKGAADQGVDFITQALATAEKTGYLPEFKELTKAITDARNGISGTQYASQFEADKARLVLAGKLSDLEDISGEQLTEAERQVKSLEDLVQDSKKEIEELRGINGGIDTVGKAVKALADAMYGRNNNAATTPSPNTITGTGNASFDTTTGKGTTKTGVEFDRASLVDAAQEALAGAPGGAGANSIYDALASGGYSLADYNKMFGMPAGTLEKEAAALGRPIFHDGTTFVPETGYALLQRGEAVFPTAHNPFTNGRGLGGDTSRLEAQLERLTAEVRRLQGLQEVGNTHAEATADLLDNVTEGGNGIRAEIMNKVELVA